MLHRNVLSRLINNEVYLKIDKLYKFPKQYIQYWIRDDFDKISDKYFVEILKKKKFIAEREIPCRIIDRTDLNNLHIQLTDSCMCKCEHCYVGEKGKNWLTIDEMKMIMDRFISLGILSIDYTGGEPTLNPDFSRIVEYGKRQGLWQMLFTNGFIADELYDVICANIDIIQISLDGNERYHNSFRHNAFIYQHVLKSLEYFSKYNKLLNLSFSLSKDNIQYLKHVRDIAKQYGAHLRISPPVPVGKNNLDSNFYYKEVLNLFREESEKIGLTPQELIKRKPHCGALNRTIYMNAKKEIFPCPLLSSREYCIGKLEDNLNSILEGEKSIELKRRIYNTIQSSKESVYFCPAFIFNLKIDDEDVFFGEI